MATLKIWTFNLQFESQPLKCITYIQEYLGYRSNDLYFLFSHSLPVVEYNFGQVQHTSQVERKTKCSKKTTAGDLAVLWAALFYLKKGNNTFQFNKKKQQYYKFCWIYLRSLDFILNGWTGTDETLHNLWMYMKEDNLVIK